MVVRQAPCRTKIDVNFYVVKVPLAYNVIFGRITLTAWRVVTSMSHLKMKFPIEFSIWVVSECQKISRQLYLDRLKQMDPNYEKGKRKEMCIANEYIKMEKFR